MSSLSRSHPELEANISYLPAGSATRAETPLTTSTEQTKTDSTLSFTHGPGALSGKFLNWMGEGVLRLLTKLAIQRRLSDIQRTLETNPDIFILPQTPADLLKVKESRKCQELCFSSCYSLHFRKKAAALVMEIAYTAYLRGSLLTPANFKALLAFPETRTVDNAFGQWNTLLMSRFLPPIPEESLLKSYPHLSTTITRITQLTEILDQPYTLVATKTDVQHATVTSSTQVIPGEKPNDHNKNQSHRIFLEIKANRKLKRIRRVICSNARILQDRPSETDAPYGDLLNEIYSDLADLSSRRSSWSKHIQRKAKCLIIEIVCLMSTSNSALLSVPNVPDDAGLSSEYWTSLINKDVLVLLNIPSSPFIVHARK